MIEKKLIEEGGKILMDKDFPIENFADNPWGAWSSAYTGPLGTYGSAFWALIMGTIALVLYMKTENIAVPLTVILLMSSLAIPFMGPFTRWFVIAAGMSFGVLIFYMLSEGR